MVEVARAAAPDAIVPPGVDWDLDGHTLKALANAIGGFEHSFTSRPNRGIQSGRDLNGHGRLGTPRRCLERRTPTEAFREEMMRLR